MSSIDTSTPVVVLRSVHHAGLGITRSLGRLGVAVYTIDPDRRAPVFASRYCRGKGLWDIETAWPGDSVRYLLDFARDIGERAILIPTSDSTTIFLEQNAGALGEAFMFPNQPAGLAASLCSKERMHALAREAGVPSPETFFPRSRQEVREIIGRAAFPIMLKPILERRTSKGARQGKYILRNARELLERYDALEDPGNPNLMLQEYIPGGEDTIWMFNGYFDARSECLLGFTGKKLRQFPAYTGATSLGICLHNDAVDRTTRRFMKAVGYRGILDIGYRYDARDGQYKVLDVNPRIGSTFRLFVGEQGMDVARALYLDMTGQPFMADRAREGRKWIVEDLDFISSVRYAMDGKLGPGAWLRSFSSVEEGAFFAWDDRRPMLQMLVSDAFEVFRRSRRKYRRPGLTVLPAASADRSNGGGAVSL